MKTKKHRPARPHWERVAARRQNKEDVQMIDYQVPDFAGFGGFTVMKTIKRSAPSK